MSDAGRSGADGVGNRTDLAGEAPAPTSTDGGRGERRTRGWPRRRVVAVVVAAVLVGGIAAYAFWWTEPDAFGGHGNGVGARQQATRMHPVSINMGEAFGDDETITVHSVRPNLARNTAAADIDFVICEVRSPYGLADSIDDACTSVEPVDDQRLRLGDALYDDRAIMMTITPHRAGTVVVRGMWVDYTRDGHHLWQTGTELAGLDVRLRVE